MIGCNRLGGGPHLMRLSTLVGVLAAITLVIAGAGASRASPACDPCPPDCPMMAGETMGGAHADHHGEAPAEKPGCCDHGLRTQTSAALPPLFAGDVEIGVAAASVRHDLIDDRAAPSRPPDRALRPPIA